MSAARSMKTRYNWGHTEVMESEWKTVITVGECVSKFYSAARWQRNREQRCSGSLDDLFNWKQEETKKVFQLHYGNK